ncbi:MAG: hypothetical protein PHD87_05905 [Candidatus Cloacimonetes bacterium]|nr:hypothetical protein [Candidatus Cloacimonadota bacterium]
MKARVPFLLLALALLLAAGPLGGKGKEQAGSGKRLDTSPYHNVGNIWLRVSNFGFFGGGPDAVSQYPSLEYPGGSGIDYLWQGGLWFGAKKYRRDQAGRKLYWLAQHPGADSSGTVAEGSPDWLPGMIPVVDTLVSVGLDGSLGVHELLPAYNPLVAGNPDVQNLYLALNSSDQVITASSRRQKRGEDDDSDGIIDEDFVGYTFPLRAASELPWQYQAFGGLHIHQTDNYNAINTGFNAEIWFPLGFMDLADNSYPPNCFALPYDDDMDGQTDEDGAPVSEQDFISYFFDYCPFGTPGDRDVGVNRAMNRHYPLNLKGRQMSYQWSYDYIKNLVYVEYDITNMNIATQDTLFDCCMGIYVDSDCGPQVMGGDKAYDDVSGYVKGTGYEFAFTKDADSDGGLTTGIMGARVCTPDPELLRFHCWYWSGVSGPDDRDPISFNYAPKVTANEKYWLLTGRNPNPNFFQPLRPEQLEVMEYVQPTPTDTRFLFAFYGAQPGSAEYNEVQNGVYHKRWNLAPGKTMKIVVALFPGETMDELKRTARWAKEIYGRAQDLVTVVLPDTFPHYSPPEPPAIPRLYAEIAAGGNQIDLYWDNRSEFSYDPMTVSSNEIGWQDPSHPNYIPGLDSDPLWVDWSGFPPEFQPRLNDPSFIFNSEATVNPYTAVRLRHDFQGYGIWGRSGSGSQEDWSLIERWDKIDTWQDHLDYQVNLDGPFPDTLFVDYGGYLGIDKGLPNPNAWPDTQDYGLFTRLDENYAYEPNPDELFYGWPVYDPRVDWSPELALEAKRIASQYSGAPDELIKTLQARLFKHPQLRDEIYDALLDTKLIPLPGHGGQTAIPSPGEDNTALNQLREKRLARRYYRASILNPTKGKEFYVAATAFDRGIPVHELDFLETGRDPDANMLVFFPGALAREDMEQIYVVPNPYLGSCSFDGRRENDPNGDKSRRLWFVNLPQRCVIRVFTLAGDLVQEIEHDGAYQEDVITVSKAVAHGLSASGIHAWDLLSRHRQVIAPGVYLFSVQNKADNRIKVGKFVIVK